MFEKFVLNKELKNVKRLANTAYEVTRSCKARLYDIEHDLLPDSMKWYAINKCGSLDAYKKEYEDCLEKNEEIYNKYVDRQIEIEIQLIKLNKKQGSQ